MGNTMERRKRRNLWRMNLPHIKATFITLFTLIPKMPFLLHDINLSALNTPHTPQYLLLPTNHPLQLTLTLIHLINPTPTSFNPNLPHLTHYSSPHLSLSSSIFSQLHLLLLHIHFGLPSFSMSRPRFHHPLTSMMLG